MNKEKKIVLNKDNQICTILIPVETENKIVYKSAYSDKTEEDYISEWYKVVSYDDGIRISIEQDYKDYNVWKWEETTEEKFVEMLGILPPEKYTVDHKKDIEIFRMQEYLSWPITAHFLKIKKGNEYKYYKWNFDINKYKFIWVLADLLK